VELHKISDAEARKIEPRVQTVGGHALWSPTTKSADNSTCGNEIYFCSNISRIHHVTTFFVLNILH
jgi:hypothetical protein